MPTHRPRELRVAGATTFTFVADVATAIGQAKAAAGAEGPVQVIMFGAMLGAQAETAALIGELIGLAGAPPVSQDLANLPYRDLKRSLAGLGSAETGQPGPVISKSEFFRRPIPRRAITELLDTFSQDRAPGQHRELNFTLMGGAYNRVPAEATAFAHRGERSLLEHVTTQSAGPRTAPDVAAHWVRRSWASVCTRGDRDAFTPTSPTQT